MAAWSRLVWMVVAWPAVLLAAGCPGDIQAFLPCDAGTFQPCTCAEGQAGTAECSSEGRLLTCSCDGADAADVANSDAGDAAGDGADVAPRPDRIERGQVALYTFEEGEGTDVRDRDEGEVRIDLTLADVDAVEWLPDGGLRLVEATVVISNGAPDQMLDSLMATSELTIEAWVEPASASATGPGRIATLAGDGESVDFMLGHGTTLPAERDQYQARIRTSETGEEGWPGLSTPRGTARAALTHVVLTRDAAGAQLLYVDGEGVAAATLEGDFSTWDATHTLCLGNDPDGGDPFFGVYRLVAIYRVALTSAEVAQNFAAGPD